VSKLSERNILMVMVDFSRQKMFHGHFFENKRGISLKKTGVGRAKKGESSYNIAVWRRNMLE